MWGTIKAWFAGVAAKLLPVLSAYAKTAGATFVAEMWPVALKAVEKAAKMDLDGDGKYEAAKADLVAEAKTRAIAFTNSQVRQAIELALEAAKDQGLVPK